jgi:phosphate transport system substrate-binding protein
MAMKHRYSVGSWALAGLFLAATGTAQLGPISSEMKAADIDAFVARYGYKPTAVPVAVHSLSVYVNKENPLDKLSLLQIDAIFSTGRACGAKAAITTWGEAGVTDPAWANKPISLYGHDSASGTYGYFKEHALCKGDFKDTVKELPSLTSVVQSVGSDIGGIGYGGIDYKTSGVKAIALASVPGAEFVEATPGNAVSGKYPLSRFLYIYINKAPNQPLDPQAREYIKDVLSQEGKKVMVEDGYASIKADDCVCKTHCPDSTCQGYDTCCLEQP